MPKRVANGQGIKSIRDLHLLSQRELAERIGISTQALSQIESGGGMKLRNLRRAAEVLRVPVTSITLVASTPREVCEALGISRQEFDQLVARPVPVLRYRRP